MPFFKKTAHNRCSVALCAVLVPILTFSLGANLVTLGKQSHSYYRSYRHTDRLFQSESTHQLTSFVFLHNISSFVCLAAPIEKEHRRPACAPSQPCLYSAFENSTPLFFFSRICAIRSAICAAASTGGTPCLLIFDTTVYSDSSMSGLAW